MSNKKTSNKNKKQQKKSNLPLILTAVGIICIVAVVLILKNGSGTNSGKSADAQTISAGEYLTIQTSDIGSKAVFYPITVDGTAMEVFAIKASDGTIRTAFNTCQSCYTSGAGYYKQEGNDLVCQNCGFHFTPDEVEIQSGGCNPWPIFAANKTVTEDSIQISYDFLKASSAIFANWKR